MEQVQTTFAEPEIQFQQAPNFVEHVDAPLVPIRPPGSRPYGFYKGMPKPPGSGAKKGHRKKQSKLRDVCARITAETGVECDPVTQMLWFIAGYDQAFDARCKKLGIPNPYGDHNERKTPVLNRQTGEWTLPGMVNMDVRLAACKYAAPYINPRLTSTTISTDNDTNDVEDRARAVEALSRNPVARQALETLEAEIVNQMTQQEAEDEAESESNDTA
jgi:hypothetical protein